MGAIEDTPKVLQDFLAPELRGISARLDALEKRFDEAERRADERHKESKNDFEKRFTDAEQRAQERHNSVMALLQQSNDIREMKERLARLELQQVARQESQQLAHQ